MKTSPRAGRQAKYTWRDVERVDPPKRSAAHRVSDFLETSDPFDEATASEQASRCIQCPNPNCVAACPLGTPLVELFALTADGWFREAAELLFAANTMPEIASHVCVGGRLCEAACVLAGKANPVPIRSITRFLLDYGFAPARLPRVGDFAEPVVDERGCILVDASQMTNLPGVFAGGSIVRGPAPSSEVVRDARKAAAAIDRYLSARRPCR